MPNFIVRVTVQDLAIYRFLNLFFGKHGRGYSGSTEMICEQDLCSVVYLNKSSGGKKVPGLSGFPGPEQGTDPNMVPGFNLKL